MTDTPTLANGGAPAAAPAPAAPPASTAPPAPGPRPSAPENPRARAHSPGRDTYEQVRHAQDQAPGEAPTTPPAADQQQAPAAQGEKFKVGQYEVSAEELGAMMQRQAVEDQRRLTLPPAPEAYEAKLPADLKLPGGQEFKFDANNPSMVAARNLAHAKGWSQQDFSEALGIFASHIAGQEAALAERSRAEIAKAGVNAPQRVDNVGRWLDGFMGPADAAPIKATLVTDAHLRLFEQVMAKLESQGAASFSQSHRVPPDDKGIPGYDGMSFEQKRFAQDQAAAARRAGR